MKERKVKSMGYSDSRGFTNKYFNFQTLLIIFLAIPTIVVAILMSYVMYIAVRNNMDTLVAMITPSLLQILTYGTLAVVFVVIVMLLIAIVKFGGKAFR